MTTGGFLVMVVSVGLVCWLFGWSIYKVLTTPGEEEKLHGFEKKLPERDTSEGS